MGSLKLPSGRVLETRDALLWGDEVHIISVGLRDPEEYSYAKIEAAFPELTRKEIAELSREDGRVVQKEANRIFDAGQERSEEAERPFGSGSRRKSRA